MSTTAIRVLLFSVSYEQSVKLHSAVTFQMLHSVITFENGTSCCNTILLRHNVTFLIGYIICKSHGLEMQLIESMSCPWSNIGQGSW